MTGCHTALARGSDVASVEATATDVAERERSLVAEVVQHGRVLYEVNLKLLLFIEWLQAVTRNHQFSYPAD